MKGIYTLHIIVWAKGAGDLQVPVFCKTRALGSAIPTACKVH